MKLSIYFPGAMTYHVILWDLVSRRLCVFLSEGLSRKEIPERLFIRSKTVENHRINIMNKLNLHNSIDLIRFTARLGLIDVNLWKG